MTLLIRQSTTEATEPLSEQPRDISLSAHVGVLYVIKQELLARRDAGSLASARCTFVNTNELTPLMPRNSAVESVIKSLAL